jgi:hypothetical protein
LPSQYIFSPYIPPDGNSSGVIGGVPLPNAATQGFFGESTFSVTFSANDLNPTMPGTLAGTLTTCNPDPCNETGFGQFFHVAFDIPGQWTFTIEKSAYITEYYLDSIQFTTVPEPGSGTLLALGSSAMMCLYRYRRRRRASSPSRPATLC